jgi:ComF family protein
MKKFCVSLFDFFLPRFCAACKLKLGPSESVVCMNCFSEIKLAEPERLREEYARKFQQRKIITDFISLFVFEKEKALQHIIHSLKYENRFNIGLFLGSELGKNFHDLFTGWQIDLIIPVPLHRLKKAERGFNQATYIAKGLSRELKIKYSSQVIKRNRYTESQTTLDMHEREMNMSGAFSLKSTSMIKNKSILLIDDVITTGATITECGKVLIESGAKKVYAASVAIADQI